MSKREYVSSLERPEGYTSPRKKWNKVARQSGKLESKKEDRYGAELPLCDILDPEETLNDDIVGNYVKISKYKEYMCHATVCRIKDFGYVIYFMERPAPYDMINNISRKSVKKFLSSWRKES